MPLRSGARTERLPSDSLVLVWRPKMGAKQYTVQISKTRFYWRVSVVDADNNTGDYTTTKVFRLSPRK